PVGLGALEQLATELGIEPDRLHARRSGADHWPAALIAPRDQRVDLVAGLGLGGERLNVPLCDRLARLRVSVDAGFGHSPRSRRYLSRMGIAWMTIWLSSTVISTTTSSRLPAATGPMSNLRSGYSPAS